MIKAERRKWALFVFDTYLKNLLKKHFNDFIIVNQFPQISSDRSLVVAPNHFSWWDGFFVYYLLKKKTNKKIYIMMLEEQLRRYWFFQKIGCFSTNPNNKQSSVSTLRYVINLLNDPGNCVVIFPQGEIEPFDKSPLRFNKGIEFLSAHSKVDFDILPLANKIFYTNEKLPLILSRIGNILTSEKLREHEKLLLSEFQDNLKLLSIDYNVKGESIF